MSRDERGGEGGRRERRQEEIESGGGHKREGVKMRGEEKRQDRIRGDKRG